MRESGQSWKELLVDLKARGLVVAPQAAIGDGALGFWKALDEAFPTTRHQRCWLHKTLNVLDKLPKSMQPSAHKDLREIWLSPSRGAAEAAMTIFAEKYAPKWIGPISGGSPPGPTPTCCEPAALRSSPRSR